MPTMNIEGIKFLLKLAFYLRLPVYFTLYVKYKKRHFSGDNPLLWPEGNI